MAAILYKAVGRNPIAGILLGFSATSAGFSACLLSIDALLGGLSTEAMKAVDSSYIINPLANSVFMFAFTFFITVILTVVNNKVVEPKLSGYKIENIGGDEDINAALTPEENKGLKWAGWGFIVSIGIIALLSIPLTIIVYISPDIKPIAAYIDIPIQIRKLRLIETNSYFITVNTSCNIQITKK